MPKKQDTTEPQLTINGQPFDFSLDDVSAREAREFRLAAGMPYSEGLELAGKGDLEAIAMLVWLVRKRDNPRLMPDDVLETITPASMGVSTNGHKPVDPTQDASS